jgi:hypothetical protein
MATKDLSELRSTVIRVRGRTARYRDEGKSLNEQDTKSNLIEPILEALGWDLHELDEVRREYRLKPSDKPVDYGLFAYRTPLLFVEAKSLDQDLEDRKWAIQVLNYANVAGVEWGVLTNGDAYRIYNTHAPVPLDEKLFRTVRISDAAAEDNVVETLALLSKENLGGDRLSLLWKAQHVDRQVGHAVERLIAQPKPTFVRLVRAETKGLAPREIQASLRRAKVRIDFPEGTGGIGPVKPRRRRGSGGAGVGLRDLIDAGIVTPPFRLQVNYKGHELAAEVRSDATVVFDGKTYPSLSAAGGVAKAKVVGAGRGKKAPATNGWDFWKFFDPKMGHLREMADLRSRFLEERKRRAGDGGKAEAGERALRVVSGQQKGRRKSTSD